MTRSPDGQVMRTFASSTEEGSAGGDGVELVDVLNGFEAPFDIVNKSGTKKKR